MSDVNTQRCDECGATTWKRALMLLRDLLELDCSTAQAWARIAAEARGKPKPQQIPLGKARVKPAWQTER